MKTRKKKSANKKTKTKNRKSRYRYKTVRYADGKRTRYKYNPRGQCEKGVSSKY